MKMLDHLNVLEYELKKIFANTDRSVYNQYSQCFPMFFLLLSKSRLGMQLLKVKLKVIILCSKQHNQKPVVKPIDYIKEQINNIF